MELEYTHLKDLIQDNSKKSILPELFGRRIGYSKPRYPGFYHIHHTKDYAVKYFDEEACKEFNATLEEIRALGGEFQKLVTHPEDLQRVTGLLKDLEEQKDENEILTYFQRIKLKPVKQEGYTLVITSVRLNIEDSTFVCMTNTTDQLPVFTKKICNALNAGYETKHFAKNYLTLTNREKDIFKRLAKGLTVKMIAFELFRSERTIEQHKKNIYKKLKINKVSQILHISNLLNIR